MIPFDSRASTHTGMSSITSAPDAASSVSWLSPGAGITSGYDGNSEVLRAVIITLSTLSLYNACELVSMITLTFTHHRGLYFWTLLCSSIGIIPYSLGFMLKFLNLATGNLRWIAITLLTVGCKRVNAPSPVLYRDKNANRGSQGTPWSLDRVLCSGQGSISY